MDLNIESHEGGIYIAYFETHGQKEFVKNNKDSPLRFNSVTQVKDHFVDSDFDNVWLHHSSAYDEMIGLSCSNEELKVRLAW